MDQPAVVPSRRASLRPTPPRADRSPPTARFRLAALTRRTPAPRRRHHATSHAQRPRPQGVGMPAMRWPCPRGAPSASPLPSTARPTPVPFRHRSRTPAMARGARVPSPCLQPREASDPQALDRPRPRPDAAGHAPRSRCPRAAQTPITAHRLFPVAPEAHTAQAVLERAARVGPAGPVRDRTPSASPDARSSRSRSSGSFLSFSSRGRSAS